MTNLIPTFRVFKNKVLVGTVSATTEQQAHALQPRQLLERAERVGLAPAGDLDAEVPVDDPVERDASGEAQRRRARLAAQVPREIDRRDLHLADPHAHRPSGGDHGATL